jgi:hypothetical protein
MSIFNIGMCAFYIILLDFAAIDILGDCGKLFAPDNRHSNVEVEFTLQNWPGHGE